MALVGGGWAQKYQRKAHVGNCARHWLIDTNLDIFNKVCVLTFTVSGLILWLCVELFWGDSKFTLLNKLYTHYMAMCCPKFPLLYH